MMKKLILPILALFLLTHTGCSSSDVQEDSEVAASDDESFAEEGEEDFADGEESDDGEETADSEEGGDEEESEDEGEEVAEGEDEGEEEADETADAGEKAGDEAAEGEGEEDLAMDEGDEESEFPEEVADETATADTGAAPTDESLFTADNGSATETAQTETPAETPVEEPPKSPTDDLFKANNNSAASAGPVSYAPLMKIKDAPFERGGALLNRVYLARSGDTLKSISQKIYQADRTKDLQKWNPGVRRTPRVGDKVYFNSPRDPQDATRMLTYYEDAGIQPQVHMTKEGDNIRELGSSLLGHRDGWKELWSTNLDVASKGALPAGIELKYWPESSAPAPVVAETAPAAPATPTDPMAQTPPMGTDPTQVPPTDPGQNVATNGMPPTDPTMGAAVDPVTGLPAATPEPSPGDMAGIDPNGQVNSPDTAPPPVATGSTEMPTTPSEGDPVKKKGPAPAEVANASDDTMMMLGVCGVALILLVGVFIIMKKNRARQIDLSQTQV